MKRHLTPILTVGFAIILIAGIALAAENKKRIRPVTNSSPEEESLRTELLDAVNDNKKKLPGTSDGGKVTRNKPSGKTGQLKSKI